MKFITLLHKYIKGIRASVFVLTLMMAWSIFSGIVAFGRAQYILSDTQTLKSADTSNAYMLMYFPSGEEVMTGKHADKAEKLERVLESESIVAHVFSIRVANPVQYNDTNISIVLYEPEMLAFFPELEEMGIDFSDDPDGCILGSKIFSKLNTGDSFQLNFSKNATKPILDTFTVAGYLTPPYRRMQFTTSATIPYASDLFSEGDIVIMQATDNVMQRLDTLAKRIEHDRNLMVVFKDGTTKEEQEQLLMELAPDNVFASLDQILLNSESESAEILKEEMPQPLFLAVSSMVAYLSITVLVLKKKEKDIAVLYLCGASSWKCAMLSFAATQLYALLPVAINICVVLLWPQINWNFSVHFTSSIGEVFGITARDYVSFWLRTLDSSRLNNDSLFIILGYYIVTSAISVAATAGAMLRHTPQSYSKGASQ